MLYYCEATLESKLTVHRGTKDGPVIAVGVACLLTPGSTDVHLEDSNTTLHLDHVYHKHTISRSEFTYHQKRLHWHGQSQLFDDEKGHLLAQFHPVTKGSEDHDHLLGTLIISPAGKYLMDLAVITALVMEQRSPEGKNAVVNPTILTERRCTMREFMRLKLRKVISSCSQNFVGCS